MTSIQVKISNLVIVYGILIPVLSGEFFINNINASIAMVASCFMLGLILRLRKGVILNFIIAVYTMRVYLLRPYTELFYDNLEETQKNLIDSNNFFFNATDATTVYLSLLSILIAWYVGLSISSRQRFRLFSIPIVFSTIDEIIKNNDWKFWTIWLILTIVNYKSGLELWQSVQGELQSTLFAYGMLSLTTINYACLFAVIFSKHSNTQLNKKNILLIPCIYEVSIGFISGGRGALFYLVAYVLFLVYVFNYKRKTHINFKVILLFIVLSGVVLTSGMFAYIIKEALKGGATLDNILPMITVFMQKDQLSNGFYFFTTIILHRLSSLQAQFLILNDHFVHFPWDYYNPVAALMRIINDLVPGDVFNNVLTINQLYNFIYLDQLVSYNSEAWSIQGTMYIYFGHYLTPLFVVIIGFIIGLYSSTIELWVKKSPSFAIFFIILVFEILDNGTVERIFVVDLVRPLLSFIFVIIIHKVMVYISSVRLN